MNRIDFYKKEIKSNNEKINKKNVSKEKYNSSALLYEDNPNKKNSLNTKVNVIKKDIEKINIENGKLEKRILLENKIIEKLKKRNISGYNKENSVHVNFTKTRDSLYKKEQDLNFLLMEEFKIKDINEKINFYSNLNNIKDHNKLLSKNKNKISELEKKLVVEKEEINNRKSEIKKDISLRTELINRYSSAKYLLEIEKETAKELDYENNKYIKYFSIDNFQSEIENLKRKLKKKQSKIDIKREEVKKLKELYNFLYEEINLKKVIKKSDIAISVENLNAWYGGKQALFDISLDFPKNKVIAIIGPSGCGKSTFLRTLNRINDEIDDFKLRGRINFGDYDIYKLRNSLTKEKMHITELRTKIGMIFQQPNPFPMSIYKNVAYGPKINGIRDEIELNNLVEESLKRAAIWDVAKNNLNALGTSLSGGEQQRLCIARAIANKPEILLMDEPTSSLDPMATTKIEKLILELKETYTIIMVTHSMQQAARVSDFTAFFYQGQLIEFGKTKKLFTQPRMKKTSDYIRGRFG